jgi:hypothetical protein
VGSVGRERRGKISGVDDLKWSTRPSGKDRGEELKLKNSSLKALSKVRIETKRMYSEK